MFSTIFTAAVGYVVAVIFPVPFISQAILNAWSAVGTKVKGWFVKKPATAVANTAPVYTGVPSVTGSSRYL